MDVDNLVIKVTPTRYKRTWDWDIGHLTRDTGDFISDVANNDRVYRAFGINTTGFGRNPEVAGRRALKRLNKIRKKAALIERKSYLISKNGDLIEHD